MSPQIADICSSFQLASSSNKQQSHEISTRKQDGLIWPHPSTHLVSLKALRGADQAHLHQAIEVLEQAQKVVSDGFFGVVADGGFV